mgnify:CR=1
MTTEVKDPIAQSNKKYRKSEAGKATLRKYFQSEKAKKTRKSYQKSESGIKAKIRYQMSERGRETYEKHLELTRLMSSCQKWLMENPNSTSTDFLNSLTPPKPKGNT